MKSGKELKAMKSKHQASVPADCNAKKTAIFNLPRPPNGSFLHPDPLAQESPVMKCVCGSSNLIQTDFRPFGNSGFYIQSTKSGWLEEEIILPEVWICKDCRQLKFLIKESDMEIVKEKGTLWGKTVFPQNRRTLFSTFFWCDIETAKE